MKFVLWRLALMISGLHTANAHVDPATHLKPEEILYQKIVWPEEKPEYEVFYTAISGYQSLQDSLHLFEKPIITIIDFSRPSTAKRLWVVDLDNYEVLLNTHVAHGRNSGEIMATRFSNRHESFQSSLGFYTTGKTYIGKHGLSLTLEGLEQGINDQASRRAIVVHGADYLSESFVKQTGRLGRSQGCPAVSMDVYKELIGIIKNETCLFIYSPVTEYLQQSRLVPKKPMEDAFAFHPYDMIERF